MLTYILLGLAVVIVGILIAASMKPNTVHYERSTVINASPERILPHITDFHKWKPWSPWEKKDPGMKREFSGAGSGAGAKYHWTGNNKVGEGSMEILSADSTGVHIEMRFIKPFATTCAAHFMFAPKGSATHVRWGMVGPNLFMGKVMSVFMDMDKMIGKDFENGLAGLKAEAEKH
jgi:Polyketide cyclase / dehydrase and lipid transport